MKGNPMTGAKTWKAVMLEGSVRKFVVAQEGAGYRWQSASGTWYAAASEREALEGLCLHLAQLGGHRELIPEGEPMRAELMLAMEALSRVMTAAWQHQAARKKLNGLAQQAGSLTFDHPDVKAVAEAERGLDKALEGFSVKPASSLQSVGPAAVRAPGRPV